MKTYFLLLIVAFLATKPIDAAPPCTEHLTTPPCTQKHTPTPPCKPETQKPTTPPCTTTTTTPATTTPCTTPTTPCTRPTKPTTHTTPCTPPTKPTTPCTTHTTPCTTPTTSCTTTAHAIDTFDGPLLYYVSSRDCASLPDQQILLDKYHCRRYHICNNRRAYHRRCKPGEWYDRATRSCRPRALVTNCLAYKD